MCVYSFDEIGGAHQFFVWILDKVFFDNPSISYNKSSNLIEELKKGVVSSPDFSNK